MSILSMSASRKVVVFCALAAGLTLSLATVEAATAAPYEPAGRPTVSTSSPAPGAALTVAGGGFRASSLVRVVIHSEPVVLGTGTADAAGDVALDVRIPSSFRPGSKHVIDLRGQDPAGRSRVLSRPVTLAGGRGGLLPRTGLAVIPIVGGGGALLLAGGVLIGTGRIRRDVPAN